MTLYFSCIKNKFNNKVKLLDHFPETKSSINKQAPEKHFNCFEEYNLNKLISELAKDFNYHGDYDKQFPIHMQLWDEINKSEDHRNHVLLEAQANKGKRSDALCCFLVEQEWLLTHTDTKSPSESRILDNFRKEALCEQALRKLTTRGVQNVIVSIVEANNYSSDWNPNEEQKNQESILSQISYILGLTEDKANGAKNRLGLDPITSIINPFVTRDLSFIRQNIGGENPDLKVTHTIADAYYRCNSEKEKLPNEEVIDGVQQEIIYTIQRNSSAPARNWPSSIDSQSSAYGIISKTILDPVISEKMKFSISCKKNKIDIQKEYLATDETLDIKSSPLYSDVENYLLSINKSLTEDDILSCAKDYYEFFRERLALNIPSLAVLEPFQSLNGNQNKRNGIVFDR